jgi:hypothetical protein
MLVAQDAVDDLQIGLLAVTDGHVVGVGGAGPAAQARPSVALLVLYAVDVWQWPTAVEVGLGGSVKT